MSKAIVLVAFGSANLEGIKNSVELLENDLQEAFGKEYCIFKAFTSKRIIGLLKERNNYVIPYLGECFFNLVNDGYEEVNIVPLHMMQGKGYDTLISIKDEYNYSFKKLRLLDTLLCNDDVDVTIKGIVNALSFDIEDGKVLLAGHGSKEECDIIYSHIQEEFNKRFENKFYMATLEGNKTLDKAISEMKRDKVNEVTIKPLFIIPGKHYTYDICKGKNSYIEILKENNIEVKISKSSLLQYKEIRNLYVNNILEAIKK